MVTKELRTAFRFFHANAGGIVGQTAIGALQLAKAEAQLKASDVVVVWAPDEDADMSFVQTWPKSCQDHWNATEHEAESCALVRTCPTHGVSYQHSDYLASLSGIIDADSAYRRVVVAELALEVFSTIL